MNEMESQTNERFTLKTLVEDYPDDGIPPGFDIFFFGQAFVISLFLPHSNRERIYTIESQPIHYD